jgi:hypothetical protein
MKRANTTPEEFFSSFSNLYKGKIQQTEDLERIIKLAFEFGNFDIFEDLAFEAKYLSGLTRIIQNKDNTFDEEYFTRIKSEYTLHINKVKEYLSAIITPGSSFIKEILEKKYLELTHESLGELNKLCEDLSRIKSYINDLKDGGKGF